jgi:hypothetical protein
MPIPSARLRPVREPRARRCAGSALALAGPSLALLVAGCGSAAARGAAPAGALPVAATGPRQTCPQTVQNVLRDVAMRTYDQAASGPNVSSATRRLARSGALAAAVARDDPPATTRALRPLLKDQIERIVVTRGRRVLADLGTGAGLAPAHGVIRDAAGAPVGRYTLSVGRDAGIARLIRALTGAQVVMRAGGHRVATTLRAARKRLPPAGTATVAGVRYSISSFRGTAFPADALQVWLLGRSPNRAVCGATPAATVANAIGDVANRLLVDEGGGAATARVLGVVAGDPRFVRAVAADDPAALRREIIRFFRNSTLHVVRIRAVTANGRLVGDVGGPYVLAPASAPLRLHGRVIGRVTLSIQDDTGTEVLLGTPAGQVAGSTLSPGPATVPARGSVTYRGRAYQAFSFPARAFPSGPLRISLLVPTAAR